MRENMTKKIICAIGLMLLSMRGFAAKLDMDVDTSFRIDSWSNLNFASSSTVNSQTYFVQNANFGVTLKDLRYIPDSDSTMDIGVKFSATGINTQGQLQQPMDSFESFYPDSSFKPWVREAYLKANDLFDKDITLTAGRQSFILGTGLTLSDNGIGMTGLDLRFHGLIHSVSADVFAFQPKANDSGSGSISVVGLSADCEGEGLWQFYSFAELDDKTTSVISVPVTGVTRSFSGVSYSMRYGQLSFDAEAAIEKGEATAASGYQNVDFNGKAAMFSAKWEQYMGFMGEGSARFAVGRGSGDDSSTANTDEAFFPSFGQRYSNFGRSGFGQVFGASLYDALGGDSSTKTGMPAGLSGIQVVNMGASAKPFSWIDMDLDLFFFEADTSSTTQKKLGSEVDFKLGKSLGNHFDMSLSYGVFMPGAAYADGTPSATRLSFLTSARF